MGTPLTRVYEKFLGHIDDKEWLLVEDEVIEYLLQDFLESATVDFTQCRKDLTILPPEQGEVEYKMDGLTSTITFSPKDSRKHHFTIIGSLTGSDYYEEDDYTINGNEITFHLPPTEDIIVQWSVEGEFVSDLDLLEIRILAHAMVLHYLKPKIMTQDSLKQFVSDKDFTKLSGANMLLRLMGLEKAQQKQLEVLQSKYAFKDFKGFN